MSISIWENDVLKMTASIWKMTVSIWKMTASIWNMTVSIWNMAVSIWDDLCLWSLPGVPAADGVSAANQGLTLVHISAQRERFLWYMGCVEALFRGCQGVPGGV